MRTGLAGLFLIVGLTAAAAQTAEAIPVPPTSPPVVRDPAPATSSRAKTAAAEEANRLSGTRTEMQELVEAARAIAKTSREGVDYERVMPDLLTQILAKLDKIEDKLDKIETSRSLAKKPGR